MADKITNLHKALINSGYAMESEADFRKNLNDPAKRKAAYNALVSSGYAMEDYSDFEKNIGYGPQPAPQPATTTQSAQPTQAASTTQPAAPATSAEPATTAQAQPAQGGWQPTTQEQIAMMHDLFTMNQNFQANMAASRQRVQRMMDYNPMTPEGRQRRRAAEWTARMAGAPASVTPGMPGVGSPIPVGVTYGEDGKAKTKWMLQDGTVTDNMGVAVMAENVARQDRLQHEFTNRMKRNGLDVSNQEDVETQAIIDAIHSGHGIDPDKRADIARVLQENGLDINNQQHIMWAVTGNQEKVLEHRLKVAEDRVRQLNHQREDELRKNAEEAEKNKPGFWDMLLHPSQYGISNSYTPAGGTYARPSASSMGLPQTELDKQIEQATAEVLQINKALRDYRNADSASRKNWFGQTMQGLWDGITDPNTWTFGVVDLSMNDAVRRADLSTDTGRALLESYSMGQDLRSQMPTLSAWYNGGHFAGEMLGDPITYISFGTGSFARQQVMKGIGKAAEKRMANSVAKRFAEQKVLNRMAGHAIGTGVNLFTFEGLRDMRQQVIDGGWTDSVGNFHEGFSWGHALKQGGHGFLMGSAMGIFGAGFGNAGDYIVTRVPSTVGKVGVRAGQHTLAFGSEATIFAMPEIIEFHTMDDDKFDRLYAQKFGYADETDPAKRNAARDQARNSLSWDAWGESAAMVASMKIAGTATHAPQTVKHVKQVLGELRGADAREHRSFSERVANMMNRSAFDISLTKEEREELRRGGYGELSDLFVKRGKQDVRNDAKPEDGAIEPYAERVDAEEILPENRDRNLDGYDLMQRLMDDPNISQASRAKAYYILTGHMLPMATITGYREVENEDGTITIQSVAANGEVVTTRDFKNRDQADREVNDIMRQVELNSIEVGERYKEAQADDAVFRAAINEVSRGADPNAIREIYEKVKSGSEDVTESQRALVEMLDEAIERNKDIANDQRPEAIRNRIKEETGIDVDEVLRKKRNERTDEENEALQAYAKELFPEEARKQAEPQEPTAEQREAQTAYEEARLLYGRFEEGDPRAQAEADAIALRMQEAYNLVEEAFGEEAEYWMYHVNEDPWRVINDEALTPEQREAVLYYVNSASALDGIMDAAQEATERKRQEVTRSVNMRTHKDLGIILPATMKVDDRPVYVVKGDVVPFEDGTGIDRANSSESVIIFDPAKGEYEFTSPEMIFKVDEAINPQDELNNALSALEQEQGSIFSEGMRDIAERGGRPEEAPADTEDNPIGTEENREVAQDEARRPIANVEEYDQGYEQGIEYGPTISDDKLNNLIADLRDGENRLTDYGRGMLEALEYEQQNRMQRGNNEPENIPQNVNNGAENIPTPTEAPAPQEDTALSRIPIKRVIDPQTGKETQEPDFEKAPDKETAWDGLVEAVGSEKDASDIAQAQIEQARTDLEALQKKPPTLKAPKLKGSAMAMAQAKRDAAQKYQEELEAYNQKIADTQARLGAWNDILGVYNSRTAEARRIAAEERAARDAELHDEAVARFEGQQRIKAEKEAEQAAIGTHAVNPKIKEKWDSTPKTEGHSDIITLPDGSQLRGKYVLYEAGAASASHDPNTGFTPTEGFPIDKNGQSVNDRDYQRDKDAQRIVEDMAGAYDNRALQNPVVVSQDGIVLSGNNRTMSGDLAARQGTDTAYIDYLKEFGAKYGFTPEQIEGMQHPRVAFVPDEQLPYDATTFSRFNQPDMKAQSKPEAAVKLGKIVPENVFNSIVSDISRHDRMGDYYGDEKAVAFALGSLLQAGVINDKQLPELRTGTALSAAGKELIENTLIGKIFQSNPDAVRQLIAMLNVRQAVVMALSEIAANRTLAGAGYDLSSELGNAIDLVYRAKAADKELYTEGMPISPFGRMQGLFDDEFGDSRVTDATTLLLADILNSNKTSDLRKVLATYNKDAGQAASGQMDIFSGDIESKETILTRVNEHFKNATPKEQQAIIDAAIADRKNRAEQQSAGGSPSEQTPNIDERGGQPQQIERYDHQGNPIDEKGELIIEEVSSIDDITDNDFIEPTRSIALPTLPEAVQRVLSTEGKRVIIKKNILGRNAIRHDELTPEMSRVILKEALYNPTLYGQNKPISRPNNWIVINVPDGKGNNKLVVLEVNDNKDNIEIVHWYEVDERGLEKIKRQAEREDGQLLILPSESSEEAGALSGPTSDMPSADKGSEKVADTQIKDRHVCPVCGKKGIEDYIENDVTCPQCGSDLSVFRKIADLSEEDAEEVMKSSGIMDENGNVLSIEEQVANLKKKESEQPKEPTEAQKAAGNYKKEHRKVDGYDISIENKKGSVRRGTDAEGNEWQTEMQNDYGYIRGTEGVDGDHIDVFLSDTPEDGDVFVIDQVNADGTFDEHKVMYGFTDIDSARDAYLSNYKAGWTGLGTITHVSKEEFKKWVKSSKRKTKPFAEYANVNAIESQQDNTPAQSDLYTITPTTYTNKKGKKSDIHLVKFNRELSKEEQAALKEFIAQPLSEGKKTPKGWYDRKEDGYMMRSEEAAKELASMIGNEEAIADAQPLTAEDYRQAVAQTSKPTSTENKESLIGKEYTIKGRGGIYRVSKIDEKKKRITLVSTLTGADGIELEQKAFDMMLGRDEIKPYVHTPAKPRKSPTNRVSVEGLFSDLNNRGETNFADNSEPIEPAKEEPAKAEAEHEVTDDEMRSLLGDIRDILGIGEDEGGIKFRDPDGLTKEQRMKLQTAGMRLAMGLVERGAVKFEDYAKQMVGLLGDKIRPWMKAFYGGLRYVPGFDEYEFTPYEEVERFDVENFDKAAPNAIADAEMRVVERKAANVSEKANQEIKEIRNENRKKDEQQTEANTAALTEEARTVASQARSVAKTSTDRQELNRTGERIDETLEKINDQLTLLGYYEFDEDDSKFHESYGYMLTAEKKAVQDAANLAKQIVKDLGIDLKVTSSTTPLGRKAKSKNTAVRSNLAPAGGDVTITLPLNEDRELKIYIGLEPSAGKGIRRGGDNLQVERIMYRVENPNGKGVDQYRSNNWANNDVTYAELLRRLRYVAKDYLPKQETEEVPKDTPAPKAEIKVPDFPDPKDKEAVGDWLYDNADAIMQGMEQVTEEALNDEALLATYRQRQAEAKRELVVNNFVDDWFVGHSTEWLKDHIETMKAWFDYGQKSALSLPIREGLAAKVREEQRAQSTPPTEVNGYKVGDEVMYNRGGHGKWEKKKIVAFERDGRPVLDSFGTSIISEIVDWDRIKPANGVFGEAERIARQEQAQKAKMTPIEKQWEEMKKKHPDALILFRVGDFYELLHDDAKKAAGVLGLTLTKRSNGSAAVPLAGFPHHALDSYLPKLVRAGHRVAIAEQLEDPKLTKKLVKREPTEAQANRQTEPQATTEPRQATQEEIDKIADILNPNRKKKKETKPAVKPEQTIGSLFDFSEENDNFVAPTTKDNESRPSNSGSQGLAKGKRDDSVGRDEARTNGGIPTAGTDGTRTVGQPAEKGSAGRKGTDGTTHGTDEERGIQPRIGNRGRDESAVDSGSESAGVERGGTVGAGTQPKRETDGGTKGISEGEPTAGVSGRSGVASVRKKAPEIRYTNNFRYGEDGNEADNYTPSQRLEANVSAIETLADLLFSGKPATAEQKAIMSRFRGWGQVDLGKFYDVDQMANYNVNPNRTLRRLAEVIKKLDPQGEKKLFEAVKRASLTAYYTPTPIATAMNSFLSLAGYRGGNFLDPSMGNGIFEGTLPKDIQERSAITGVELDWLTGQLSRALYPDANIIIGGFEKAGTPIGMYDVVTSNVPFGQFGVNDPTWGADSSPLKRSAQNRIHNYFAVKMLEAARPGGIVSMMTTSAVMDTPSNQNIRAHIADQGEILGAIRLPDNTFQGTGAVADIIFIRKWRDDQDRMETRSNPEYQELEASFLDSHETLAPNKLNGTKQKVRYNAYFNRNRRNMIGDVQAGNQYSQEGFGLTSQLTVDEIAGEVEKAIKRIVGKRKGQIFNPSRSTREVQQAVREAYKGDGDWVSNGNLVIQDGKVGVLNAKSNEYGEVTREFEGTLKLDKMKPRIEAMIDVRTAMKKLIAGQIEGEKESALAKLREELQKAYDTFVGKYGRLQDNPFILDDIDGYTLQALETWKGGKFVGLSDIFTKNTIKPALKLDGAKTPQEAITTSLAEYGYLRPDYLEKAIGKDWEDKCADFIFKKPNSEDDYVTRDEYLSGDVVTKLAEAREAAKLDERFERNVQALEEVQPERIPFDDIAIHLGARWIPDTILNDFIKDIFGLHASSSRSRHYDRELGRMVDDLRSGVRYLPDVDSFEINIEKKELGGQAQDWETPKKSAKEILQAALEDKNVVIKYKDSEGNEHIDEEQTELANQKIADLRDKFEEWLPSDPERVEMLEQAYNDRFNRTVIRTFDGSHLNVPGLMGKELRPHQKDAVWMLINNRGGIVDHIVGAGKTLVMQAAIMEMRRMGIAKKPMIVALKSTVSQIAREFKEAFPSARVLAPSDSDFQKENRKKFIANISLNDYDCVILSHEQYCMLPHTEEAERAVIDEQMWQLDNMIEYLYGTNDQSQMTKKQIKALEKRRENLKARLEKRLDRNVDREFCFENLGVDYLFVDESHQFKSLPYVTSYQKVAGLGDSQGSSRAVALLTGIRHLQRMHQGDKGTVFLSGTTITNSLVEIYNLLNYLRPRELERLGMPTFDAWASTFAVHSSELEAGTTGTFQMKDRFRSFDNVPELSQLYAEIADVRNDTNLKLPKPAIEAHTVIVPASPQMQEINQEIINMLQNKDGSYFGIHPKDPNRAPWGLHASTLSAKAAVSPRLVFPDWEDEGGKIHAVTENVKKYYDAHTDQKGVQLIFCELGVPGNGKEYDAYTDIKNRLVNDYGIPKDEIAFIQDAPTDEKRKELFQKVRDGKVRVLIGGTKNMGTGVNVQDRITDMHMLTVPWTPSALDQCIGRGARQGNWLAEMLNNRVRVHYYATEGSLDLYKYQLLEAKGKMFTQFKMGTVNGGRSFDEGSGDEDGGMDPAEMVARLSGNPVIFERAKQEKAVKKLRALRNGFERDYQRKKAKFNELTERKGKYERLIRLNESDRKELERGGFVADEKGVYPTEVTVMEGSSFYGGRTFDKPKEAGEYIHKLLKEGKSVKLSGFGKRARIEQVNDEKEGLFQTHYEVVIGEGNYDIRYSVRLSEDATAAGVAFRNLLKRIIDNGEVYKRELDNITTTLQGMNIGDGVFPKKQELEEAEAKLKELNIEFNKLGKKEEKGKKFRTSSEIDAQYPNWLDGTTTDSGKHSTQVEGTRKTYGKVGDWIEANLGKGVAILDASSGMGYGTRDLRERGFDIEDVEPYQSEQRKAENPATYDSYDAIEKQYDYIISNAVLNVIPDDWRRNVLHDMAARLNPGGKLFINTRKAGEEKSIKDKIELDTPQEVLVKRNGRIASYQRFFTPAELKQWVESELGDGYTVEIANEKNSGTKGLAAVVVTRDNAVIRSTSTDPKDMETRVRELSQKLHTPIRIVTKAELDADAKKVQAALAEGKTDVKPEFTPREVKSLGWFDPKTGEVVVVMPNNKSVADIENSVVHEVVGHDGLQALVGAERMDEFMNEIYDHASDEIKQKIDAIADRMIKNEADNIYQQAIKDKPIAQAGFFRDAYQKTAERQAEAKREQYRRAATEEYMADMAGKIGDEGFEKMSRDEQTLWGRIKARVQKFLDAFLRKLKIPARIRLTDKDLAYILFKSWKNKRSGGGVFAEAEDVNMRRKTGYDASAEKRFRDPDMSLEEAITKMKTEAMQANTDNLQAKRDAMRAIGGNLNHLRSAMARQREYDISTAKSIKDLARVLMDNGLLNKLAQQEVKSLLAATTNAIGRQDISKQVKRVFDVMLRNHLRNLENLYGVLLTIRGSKVDARGIQVQGELDPDGQMMIKAYKKAVSLPAESYDSEGNLQPDCIAAMMNDALNRMSDPNPQISDNASVEYAGLQFAKAYVDNIKGGRNAEKLLREEIRKAEEQMQAGTLGRDAFKQFKEATEESIQEEQCKRIKAYEDLIDQMGGALGESIERAKAWRQSEKDRVNRIHHLANSDMQGRELQGQKKDSRIQNLANNGLVRWALEPLATFDQMLKMFGSKNANGEGYLQDYFMHSWIDSTDREQLIKEEYQRKLDDKAAEIFGKGKKYVDLYNYAKTKPSATIKYYDGADLREYELSQDALLYLYA